LFLIKILVALFHFNKMSGHEHVHSEVSSYTTTKVTRLEPQVTEHVYRTTITGPTITRVAATDTVETNARCAKCHLHCFTQGQKGEEQKLVGERESVITLPLKKEIAGTKLSPDTWYTITVKSLGGLLTWAVYKVDNIYNHGQIVFGAGVAPYRAAYEHDTHWKLVQSEEPGHVLLVNRSQPNAVMTWAEKSPSGKYAVLFMDHASHPDYLHGGKFRTDCLWRIEAEEGETGNYLLYNKR